MGELNLDALERNDNYREAKQIADDPWTYGAAVAATVEEILVERDTLIQRVRKVEKVISEWEREFPGATAKDIAKESDEQSAYVKDLRKQIQDKAIAIQLRDDSIKELQTARDFQRARAEMAEKIMDKLEELARQR